MKHNYEVIVGNVGSMEYTSKKLALECYKTYVSLSQQDSGRASGESVTLMQDGEVLRDFIGSIREAEANNESGFIYE